MPPEAKIYLIEDTSSLRKIAKRCLEDEGHFVIAEAETFDIALEKILEVKKSGANVAVVDGNLSSESRRCSDGHELTKALRVAIPGIKIVAFSASEVDEANYGDVYVDKNKYKTCFDDLAKAVTSL